MQQLKQNVIEYFENCLAKHGDSAQGVDYNGQESQYKRFEILSQIAPLTGKSVLDVACGVGHFYDFLQEQNLKPQHYKGIDITPGMIAHASKRLPETEFALLDILAEPPPNEPIFDYVVCCGLFHLRANNSDKEWSEVCQTMIARMYQYARYGLAFNMMTNQVDFRVDRLYYADPTYYFNFCRHKLSRRVSLRHDYPLYEFTIYTYRT
ncbi:MAG: methyltransferase family protein [bacterium]|nr:MAG: methyltransferase family protein [bacterium]